MADAPDSTSTDEPIRAGPRQPPWRVGRAALHLAVAGVLAAGVVFLFRGPPEGGDPARQVEVSDADVAHVKARWVRLWNREPTDAELRVAVDRFLREEILYREAVRLGFDREDASVRLVLVRKMETLGAAGEDSGEITDAELHAYFSLNREKYRLPAVVSFRQALFSPDRRGDAAGSDAEDVLVRLMQGEISDEDIPALGDPTALLPEEFARVSETEIDALFGKGFGGAVAALEPGRWLGPVRSGYGHHLVFVTSTTPSRIPEWAEVERRVRADVDYENRRAAADRFFQEIAAGYRVAYGDEAGRILRAAEISAE